MLGDCGEESFDSCFGKMPIIVDNVIIASFFTTHLILDHNGKKLITDRWKKFTEVGIRRLCDLIFYDKFGSYDDIVNYYGHLPKAAVDTLLAAIPQHLKELACFAPVLSPRLQWAFRTNSIHTAVLITTPPKNQQHQLPDLP